MNNLVDNLVMFVNDDTIKTNFFVLLTNIFSVIFGSIGSNVMFGIPRSHNKIKLTNETLTRLHLGFLTYYIFFMATYVQTNKPIDYRIVGSLIFLSLTLLMFSGFFTRGINERMIKTHSCRFDTDYCDIGINKLTAQKDTNTYKCKFQVVKVGTICNKDTSVLEALSFTWVSILYGLFGLMVSVISLFSFGR